MGGGPCRKLVLQTNQAAKCRPLLGPGHVSLFKLMHASSYTAYIVSSLSEERRLSHGNIILLFANDVVYVLYAGIASYILVLV
jgi:hypothetical protein